MNLPGRWVDRVQERKPVDSIILDMDSTVSETYGNQEGSAYNGYFEWRLLPSAVLLQPIRRRGACLLRHGNVHSADDCRPYWSRWSRGIGASVSTDSSEAMRPSPIRGSMNTWKRKTTCTQSAARQRRASSPD